MARPLPSSRAATGARQAATIEPSETQRVVATMAMNATRITGNTIGVRPSTTPAAVATPLPPLKAEPDREAVAEDGARPGQHRGLRAEPGVAEGRRQRALGEVEQERGQGQALAAGAQHVGGADIARADGADVARAGPAGEQQAERDRAQAVAGQERQRPAGPAQGRPSPRLPLA